MSDAKPKIEEAKGFLDNFMHPQVPVEYKATLIIAAMLYLLSPIDLIPEGLLGPLGIADDVGVIFAMTQFFNRMAGRAIGNNQEETAQAAPDQIQAHTDAPHTTVTVQAQSAGHHEQAEVVVQNPDGQPLPPPERPPRVPQRQTPVQKPPQAAQPRQQGQQTAQRPDPLVDEQHEQFLLERNRQSDDEFERMMRQRQAEQNSQDWDFKRDNPLNKRKP